MLYVPKGHYTIGAVNFPSGVALVGEGNESKFYRSEDLPEGQGLFNLDGANEVLIDNIEIDGQIIIPQRLNYTAVAGEPMNPLLTKNTSIWVRGGRDIVLRNIRFVHTGGYAVLLDARTADVQDVLIEYCLLRNCRPHLFGVSDADLNYGSWTGGIHYQGDGATGALRNASFLHNRFERVTGNCLWGHLYGFARLHMSLRMEGNHFEDCGLDGILVGGVSNGTVKGNTFHRIGYVAEDDSSPAVPRYLPGGYGVALDTSGLVRGVNYEGNSFISCNGACMDLDCFSSANVIGNYCEMPRPGTPEYTEDQIASIGPGGSGQNYCYGIQLSNTNGTVWGGESANITGNTFRNMGAGAIILACTRLSSVSDNTIDHAADAGRAPIWILNKGAAAPLRSFDNLIENNLILWPISGMQAAILEIEDWGAGPFPWEAGDVNVVRNNRLIGAGCYEFRRAPSSGSICDTVLSSNSPNLDARSENVFHREGFYGEGVFRIIRRGLDPFLAPQDVIMASLIDSGTLWNVSANGQAGTGSLTTGNRTLLGFEDAVFTGKSGVNSFAAFGSKAKPANWTPEIEAQANSLLGEDWGLIRFNFSSGGFEQSVGNTVPRVWTPFGGGAGVPSGANGYVQYAKDGAFASTANFKWRETEQQLEITGANPADAAVHVVNGWIWSQIGFYTENSSATAIQAPNGQIAAKTMYCSDGYLATASTIGGGLPAPPAAGQGKLIFDAASNKWMTWNFATSVWEPVGISGPAGNPAGSDRMVQWNNAGAFGASGDFLFNPTNSVGYCKYFEVFGTEVQAFRVQGSGIFGLGLEITSAADSVFPSSESTGRYGAREIRFRKNGSGEDASNSGVIAFRQVGDSNALNIIGAGLGVPGDRIVKLWDRVIVRGKPSQASLVTEQGYFQGDGVDAGLNLPNATAPNAIQAPNAGVYSRWVTVGEAYQAYEWTSPPPVPSAGVGKMYFDGVAKKFKYWDFPSGSWMLVGAGGTASATPAGTDRMVQWNNAGTMGADANFIYVDNIVKVMRLQASDVWPLHIAGTGFKYLPCESQHLAWYKRTGGFAYYWRVSDNGVPGGGNDRDLMTLDHNAVLAIYSPGGLIIAHNAYQAFNCAGTGVISALELASDLVSPSSQTYGKIGGREVRFRLNAGDDINAGLVSYRSSFAPDAMSIVGAGSASGNRLIRIYDLVRIGQGTSSVATALTVEHGHIEALDGSIATRANYFNALDASNGGCHAMSGHFEKFTDVGNWFGPPPGTPGPAFNGRFGSLYYDTSLNKLRYWAPGNVWIDIGTGAIGPDIAVTGQISTTRSTGPAIYAPNAYVQSTGFVANGVNYNSIQTQGGFKSGTSDANQCGYWVGEQKAINNLGQFVGNGVSCEGRGAIGGFGFAVWVVSGYVAGLGTGTNTEYSIPPGSTIRVRGGIVVGYS